MYESEKKERADARKKRKRRQMFIGRMIIVILLFIILGLCAFLVKDILEDEDITVYEAEDGSSAIELLESEQADDIDVVLMDMRMPGMDGIETTKIIRTKNGKCMEVPIIAMTADGFETDIGMLQKAGMNGLISKPVDVNTLVEHITKLAGW